MISSTSSQADMAAVAGEVVKDTQYLDIVGDVEENLSLL